MTRSSDLVEQFILRMCIDERARRAVIIAWNSPRFLKIVKYAMKNGMRNELIELFKCEDSPDPEICVRKRMCRAFAEVIERYPNILKKQHVRLGELCDAIRNRTLRS